MKTSALIRIFVYAFIALALTGVLVWGVNGTHSLNFFSFNFLGGSGFNYNDDNYKIGEGEISKDQVKELEVNWTAGDVKVNVFNPEITGTNEISISEESDTPLDEDYEMRYKVEDGVLKIMFAKPKVKFQGIFKSLDKELTINIPINHELTDVVIDTVSADIQIDSLSLPYQINLATVSGDINTNRVDADSMYAETVSGKIRCTEAIFGSTHMESVSGEIYATYLGGAPDSVSIETVSGSITLGFPKSTEGFKVEYDRVSGNFDCEFDVKINKNMAMYKNGENKISLETVSGNMKILAL
jgi:DUF4097 and DUF4098 domain-containing protein YvlB